MESRQQSVPRAQPARTASRPARLEAALASLQRARTKGVRRQPTPPLESYRSPGRDQQEQLRVQSAKTGRTGCHTQHVRGRAQSPACPCPCAPASGTVCHPWHEPKECAGSLLKKQQGCRSRGSGQPQKLRFPRWSRPHSFVHSEHQPKGVRRRQKGRKEAERAGPHSFAHSEHQPKGVRRQQKGRIEAERQP